MLATAEPTTAAVDPTAPPTRRVLGDIPARFAGVGALAFVAVVVLQNVLRGGSAPANGASSDEVLTHYADHRSITFVLIATFVLGGTALAVFIGGAMRRLIAGGRPGWAITGLIGATGVMALFAVMVGVEQALSVVASGDAPDLGAVQALWALHNSVFSVLMLSIGLALLGLSAPASPPASRRRCSTASPRSASACSPSARSPGRPSPPVTPCPVFGLSVVGFADLARLPGHDRAPPRAVRRRSRWLGDRGVTMIADPPPTCDHDLDPSPSRGRCSSRWSRPGTGPTGRRSVPSSPTTPTSSTSEVSTTGRRGLHRTGHQAIFDTIYAGSTVAYRLDVARVVAPGCIVAVATSTLDAPSGPLEGTNHSRMTAVVTEQDDRWAVTAFQNTLVRG